MHKITQTKLFGLLLFAVGLSFGQRNDCDNNAAGEITVGTSCVYQAMDSTNGSDYWNGADGSCGSEDRDDVWMWFDATATSTTITYNPDSRNAILHLFEGNCATGMTAVACANDFGNGGAETITYATTIGTRYRIRVQRSGSNNNMTGDICVYSPVACTTPTAQPTVLNLTPGDTDIAGTFTAAAPAPDNYLVVMNTTGATPSPVDGTTYTVGGTVGAGNTVVDIDGDTTFNATGLTSGTTYYFFIFSYNNVACTGGPLYNTTSPLTGNTTTTVPCHPVAYCANTYASAVEAITNVNFAGINNTTGNGTTGGDYEDFCDTATVTQGLTFPISLNGDTVGNFTNSFTVFIDWDQSGDFDDNANERYDIGTIVNTDGTVAGDAVTANITVPAGATIGTTYMRVIKRYEGGAPTIAYATDSCTPGSGYGQTEDYIVNVVASGPCSTPTAQATGLILTPTGTIIGGSFTAASPAPDSYLVVMNTTGTTPTPVDGTTYTIGGTVGAGNIVVDNDGDTTFSATSLNPSTTYYFFIFSFNQYCSGGPLYYNTSPLNGNATTGTVSYCTPSTTSTATERYIDDVEFIGTLNDVTNFGTGYTAGGYHNYSGLPNSYQQQGEGMNVYVAGGSRGHIKAWIDWDKDGTFDNATETVYDSGGIATTSTTFGYTIPLAQPIGTYVMRIRMYNSYKTFNPGAGAESYIYDFDACETFDDLAGYTEYGEAEDYTFDVVSRCDAQITSITNGESCGTSETVDLSVTGGAGVTSFHWYANETGGAPLATTATGNWTTPAISATTTYWVAADNGTCEAYERERIVAFLNAPATLTFSPSVPFICGENTPPIEIVATSTTQIDYLIDEDFESGLGSFTENNITSNTAAQDAISEWQPETSVYVPSENVWFPAVSSGFGADNFVMSNADSGAIPTENELISATVDASSYLDLTLELEMYFSRYNLTVPENVNIEVSTDGGATWPNVIANITDDVGYGTNFDFLSYDLSAFAGEANLRVRIYYYSEWGDGVAVDNIRLYGTTSINPLATWGNPPGVQMYEDAAGLIPYTGDGRSTIYVLPTPAELQSSSTWSFSASVTLANGCSATGTVNLQNRTKYFMGATNDWNDPNNWFPTGVPTSTNCVIIPNTESANISGTVDGDAYNITVQNGGTLNIETDGSVTVQNFVDVEATGTFDIDDSGSLIQVQDQSHPDYVANTGTINTDRNTNIRATDWVFWSSPVSNQSLAAVSPGTSTSYLAHWLPTVATNTNGFGIWEVLNETMVAGKGYIIKGPDAHTATPSNFTATMSGTPHNGTITRQIQRGTYNGADYAGPTATIVTSQDDNWNLIGNPYPSALDAIAFMTANTDIEGSIRLWTHGTQLSAAIADPFYEDYDANYTINDFITYNSLGASSGPGTFNGYVGSGQSFFVLMEHTAATPSTVSFDNTMRDRTYDNGQFYRTAANQNNPSLVSSTGDKHRIWLDLTAPSNQATNILVGYIDGATYGKDRLYDARIFENKELTFYSNEEEGTRLTIQGRPTPFNDTDEVPLGMQLTESGIHSISINAVDGLFADNSQDIFIEDKELGIIHDIRVSPYTFTGEAGLYENRFVLRYVNSLLDVEDHIIEETDSLDIFNHNQILNVNSSNKLIKSVLIYDIQGKVIFTNNSINNLDFNYNMSQFSNGTYIVKVALESGTVTTKKIIN